MENAPAQNLELLQARPIQEGTYDEMEAAQAAERAVEVAETQPEVVEEQSILARAGARVGEFVRDHTPRKLTAGLAVAAIAVGGAVKTSNHSAEKAEAAPTASKTLGPNALKKLCVNEGLKKPNMPDNRLQRWREQKIGSQGWTMSEQVWLLPSECNGEFKRFMWVQPEVQDPKHPKRWRAALRPKKHFVLASNRGVLGDENDPNSRKDEYASTIDVDGLQLTLPVFMENKSQTYQCAPGKRENGARVKLWERIKNLSTGKFIAGKVWKYKTRVIPPC